MLKYFSWATALSVTLNLLTIKIAFSRPVPTRLLAPQVPQADTEQLSCYMQTADGRILDLRRLCSKTAPNSESTGSTVAASKFRRDCTSIRCEESSQLRQIPNL